MLLGFLQAVKVHLSKYKEHDSEYYRKVNCLETILPYCNCEKAPLLNCDCKVVLHDYQCGNAVSLTVSVWVVSSECHQEEAVLRDCDCEKVVLPDSDCGKAVLPDCD